MTFALSNTPSRSAPQGIEDGLQPAKVIGLTVVEHPDWATDKGKFGPDDGRRFHWNFVLCDDNYEELYEDGDPIEIEGVNSATLNTKSDKSKNAQWLKAVSPEAFALVDAGQTPPASMIEGAPCLLLLEIKDNGWPKIVNVLPAPKRRAKRAAAPVVEDDEE